MQIPNAHTGVAVSARLIAFAIVGLVAFILLIVYWPVRTVPTGYRGVITVGGAISDLKNEGFTLVAPWQKLSIFNIRAEAVTVEGAEGATSDTQPVHVTLTVRYSIVPEQVKMVFEQYSRDGNLDNFVDTAMRESFKVVTARFTAPDLVAKRAQVSSQIIEVLRGKIAPYGAQVISVDVTSFLFSKEYMSAINAKVEQEQLRLVAENKLLTVQAEQKQKVAVAEADASAQRAKADGQAYATLKEATAQADALRIQNAALAQNRDVLELRRIEVEMQKAQRWNGALPTAIYAGAPVPFLEVSKQYGSPTPRN